MLSINPKKIRELYRQAPDSIRDVIESDETSRVILEIGKRNGLAIDKIGDLSYTTFLMMTGVIPAREYIGELQKSLGIPGDKVSEIAKEINARVFVKAREELKRIHEMPAHAPLVPEFPASPLPAKSAGSIVPPSGPKPISVPIRREAQPMNPAPMPAETIKATPASAALPGKPVTVPFRSLMENKSGPVEAPALKKSPETASKQILINQPPKIQASATVIASNAPHTAPPTSVKIEKPAGTSPSASPAKEKQSERSNLHEEVHRLLKEHFESTSAVSPTLSPKPIPSLQIKAPPPKEPASVSAPPAPKSIPVNPPQEAPPLTQKTPTTTYSSKDPYREPVDD